MTLAVEPGQLFQWALNASALLALAAAVVVYLKGAAREVTIKMLEEATKARDMKIGDLTADVSALHEKNRGLVEKVRVLEGVATSAAEIQQLSTEVKAEIGSVLGAIKGHHREMLGVTGGLETKLGEMIEATEHLETALGGLPLAIAQAIRNGRQ